MSAPAREVRVTARPRVGAHRDRRRAARWWDRPEGRRRAGRIRSAPGRRRAGSGRRRRGCGRTRSSTSCSGSRISRYPFRTTTLGGVSSPTRPMVRAAPRACGRSAACRCQARSCRRVGFPGRACRRPMQTVGAPGGAVAARARAASAGALRGAGGVPQGRRRQCRGGAGQIPVHRERRASLGEDPQRPAGREIDQ